MQHPLCHGKASRVAGAGRGFCYLIGKRQFPFRNIPCCFARLTASVRYSVVDTVPTGLLSVKRDRRASVPTTTTVGVTLMYDKGSRELQSVYNAFIEKISSTGKDKQW